jgi:hypothetical protein
MYLLTAVSNDGEVILMQVSDDKTIGQVINNILSTARATNVNVTKLSEENIRRNFIKGKKEGLLVQTNTDTPKIPLSIRMTSPRKLLPFE